MLDDEDDEAILQLHERDGGAITLGPSALPRCDANLTTEETFCKCSCLYKPPGGAVYERNPCDSKNNTYRCLRTVNATENSIYCEFDDPEQFVEYYDLDADPHNIVNLAFNASTPAVASARYEVPAYALSVPPGVLPKLAWLHTRLEEFMRCSGRGCWDPQ